jgi:hypothetical protein
LRHRGTNGVPLVATILLLRKSSELIYASAFGCLLCCIICIFGNDSHCRREKSQGRQRQKRNSLIKCGQHR